MLHPINWSLALPYYAAALHVRLSARLDPVRPAPHPARRPRRHPHDRLRQYRRHQRAAHRPQGPRRRDAARSTRSRARPPCCSLHRLWPASDARLARRRSAPSSATCFRSGCGSRAARASRPIIGILLGAGLAGGARLLPDLARASRPLTRYSSLAALVASAGAPVVLLFRSTHSQEAQLFALLAVLVCGSCTAANIARLMQRHRGQDRQAAPWRPDAQRRRGVRLTDEQRLDWLRLIRSDNVGPRTFRAADQPFRLAPARRSRPARPGAARRRSARRSRICSRADAEREIEAARRSARASSAHRRARLSAAAGR